MQFAGTGFNRPATGVFAALIKQLRIVAQMRRSHVGSLNHSLHSAKLVEA
jgi:hypothetical protein